MPDISPSLMSRLSNFETGLLEQADEAFAANDRERCVKLVQNLYDAMDRQSGQLMAPRVEWGIAEPAFALAARQSFVTLSRRLRHRH